MSERKPISFSGAEGNRLAADLWGEGHGPVAVLLHGGGQTRHSWGGTAAQLAQSGWRAITVDQRGHGESARSEPGHYSFRDFADDAGAVFRQVGERYGTAPVAIGASLGGLSSLLVAGEDRPPMAALVLVDVTPRMDPNGVAGVLQFMGARMDSGFQSLEEAADAVAEYLPHRPRPRSLDGLRKNLRLDADGRYRWHWDPRFLSGPRPVSSGAERNPDVLLEAASRVSVPTLLVRGRMSELVSEEHADEFLSLVPHAAYADVSGAGHMVVGDKNDVFAQAVIDFLGRLEAA
ncbi:alpha/beta fold hydrolase [Microbaculum sp. FT89]|uniref:alpha/beta fold hydrolase n=1 Tax=Microbaculum sp. FT89 TaxID=3447298 RepID=UPI003F533B7D